jgi:Phasin protein
MIQAKSKAELAPTEFPVGTAFVKEAQLWVGAQRDLLAGIEALMTGWAQRQREAFEASSRSIQKICASRDMLDLVQAQHEWVSDCLQLTASQIRAIGDDTAAITRKAATRLGEATEEMARNSSPAEPARNVPIQRAAAE